MGLFWSSSKPSVSKTEFRERVMNHLSARGWSQFDREKVKMVFAGDLNESGYNAGIDRDEIKRGIETLKKNTDISDERLKDLEEFMMGLAK